MVIEDNIISNDDFFKISRLLEEHHAVFYQLWELGVPVFTRSIPTAAVSFNKEGQCINFMFNTDFWNSLTEKQKIFIISHECMHVILKHGIRSRDTDVLQKNACNITMDVVINEILIENFGFSIDDIDPERKACWLETVFKDVPVEKNETFEYYFNKLPRDTTNLSFILMDSHSHLTGEESDFAIEKLNDSLSEDEKDSIKNIIEKHSEIEDESLDKQAGKEAGTSWKFVPKTKVVKKRKWETVIKKWSKKYLRSDFDVFEHWARVNRRMVQMPQDVILPSEMELEEKEDKSKIEVYFFLDTSGSCYSLGERFWKAAESLSDKVFIKKLYCFDTKVYPLSEQERKLYGGGGTRFDIIESFILENIKINKTKYPEAVFVITDGYGNYIHPKMPKNWHWFLTEYGSEVYLPKDSRIYKLKDFE